MTTPWIRPSASRSRLRAFVIVTHDAAEARPRALGHRRDEHRRGGGPAVDRPQRARRRVVGDAVDPGVAGVLPAAGRRGDRAVEPTPEQGGLYAWTRRAFGPVHGFICGWCLWVNNLFYFPSLLLFAAANLLLLFGPAAAGLADSRVYAVTFVLVTLWACVGLNLLGLGAGRLLQSVGSVSDLGAGGAADRGRRGRRLPPSARRRRFRRRRCCLEPTCSATLGLWSAMCFAFSGFEIGALVGEEVKDARRDHPARDPDLRAWSSPSSTSPARRRC